MKKERWEWGTKFSVYSLEEKKKAEPDLEGLLELVAFMNAFYKCSVPTVGWTCASRCGTKILPLLSFRFYQGHNMK